MEEPTVLDYVKSLLTPWKGGPIPIPPLPGAAEQEAFAKAAVLPETLPAGEVEARPVSGAPAGEPASWPVDEVAPPVSVPTAPEAGEPTLEGAPALRPIPKEALQPKNGPFPWRSLFALLLALLAQRSLEPPSRAAVTGSVLYLLAACWLVWAGWREEWVAPDFISGSRRGEDLRFRPAPLALGLVFSAVAFLAFGDNLFNPFNLLLWALALALVLVAFWRPAGNFSTWLGGLRSRFNQPRLTFSVTLWTLAVLGALALVEFFRVYRLAEVPPEMISDHAEKLLDVSDLLSGQTKIYFERNTGREAFQMYLTAAAALVFGTGLSFMSLKIGTVLCGLLTLPFIYLLGKEFGNRQVGLWAMIFAGIAYWPNVITRFALRFTLYPFFYAPMLYFLVRGLRTRNRNDFLWAGIFLGAGLHGYSPFRVVPLVAVLAVAIYLIHRQSSGWRRTAVFGLGILALVSLVVFLPLMRYALDNPAMFSYRAMTRLSDTERALPGPAWQIFLQNLWNALTMFAWDDGEVWVISVTHRPVLDVVSAALFHLGVVLVLLRYWRRRHWLDLFTLVSIPVLMLPSILSLAFPAENPSLNRPAGAIIPVFMIAGLAMESLISGLRARLRAPSGQALTGGLALFLLFWSANQNYDLLFNQYLDMFKLSSWNTSEMGSVVRNFTGSIGSIDTAWVAAYPYWVDTRLVGINAGYPTRDLAIWPDHYQDTLADPRPKLFLINREDVEDLALLQQLYPQGSLQLYDSKVESKDFLIFYVPPAN